MDGFDGRALDSPHAVVAFDHARASTRWQEQAQALGKRRDVLAAHPACDTGGLCGKQRLAEDSLDRLDTRGIESAVALQVTQLRRNVDDIARGRTVTKVDQDRGSDLRLVGKSFRDAVGEWLGQRTRRNVQDYARVGGDGLRYRLGLGWGNSRLGRGRNLLRFRRTKQRKLLSHGPSTSYPIRLRKQEPRSE